MPFQVGNPVIKEGAMGTNWSPHGDSPGGNVLTREGYERMKQELDWLIRVKRPEVPQRLREAREFGTSGRTRSSRRPKRNRPRWKPG